MRLFYGNIENSRSLNTFQTCLLCAIENETLAEPNPLRCRISVLKAVVTHMWMKRRRSCPPPDSCQARRQLAGQQILRMLRHPHRTSRCTCVLKSPLSMKCLEIRSYLNVDHAWKVYVQTLVVNNLLRALIKCRKTLYCISLDYTYIHDRYSCLAIPKPSNSSNVVQRYSCHHMDTYGILPRMQGSALKCQAWFFRNDAVVRLRFDAFILG